MQNIIDCSRPTTTVIRHTCKACFRRRTFHVPNPLSYNITGESAPIFFQSKKCRQKHGGFQHLLTPYGSSGSGYLPLTNRDPTIKIKSFTPQFFCTIFYLFFRLLNLLSKIVEKVVVLCMKQFTSKQKCVFLQVRIH